MHLVPDGSGGYREAGPPWGTIFLIIIACAALAAYALAIGAVALWAYCLYRNWRATLLVTALLLVISRFVR